MSHKEIKYLLLFFIVFSVFSCGINSENESKKSTNIFARNNFNSYKYIYDVVNDSIKYFTASKLYEFKGEYCNNWELDSLIVLNSTKDKMVGALIISYGSCRDCVSDYTQKLLGKKINGKWYFLKGSSLIIPRDLYGKTEMNPLSFHELSQIARKELLESALIKNKQGEYLINDNWVDGHFYNNGYAQMGWNPKKDKEKYDSVHWYYIMKKWKQKIDTTKFKPFNKSKPNT